MSYGSIKRFESTGTVSLLSLTKAAVALGCEGGIKDMSANVPYLSIEEAINAGR